MQIVATVNLGIPGPNQSTGLYQAMLDAGLNPAADCGGTVRCGRGLVLVEQGDLEPPDQRERDILARAQAPAGTRLVCRAWGRGAVTIKYRPTPAGAVAKTAVEKAKPLKSSVTLIDFQGPTIRSDDEKYFWSGRLPKAIGSASPRYVNRISTWKCWPIFPCYRRRARELARRVEVIELMLDAGFEDDFIKHACLGEPD